MLAPVSERVGDPYGPFWADVASGNDTAETMDGPMVVHDDYPEYTHLRCPVVAAEGAHDDAPRTGS